MFHQRVRSLACLGVVVALGVLGGNTSQARADDAAALQAAIDRIAPSIVTIKCLIKMNMGGAGGGGGEQEIDTELTGAVISSAGLVLCSNTQLGGIGAMVMKMLGGRVPGLSMTTDVTDVKVLWGPEDEELEAELVARDADLDLAWVRIKASDKTFPAIDFSQAATPTLGQRLVGVRRMGKHFDRAAVVFLGTTCGVLEKPRALWAVQEQVTQGLGLPLFTLDGNPVGVVITQTPELEGGGGGGFNPLSMMGSISGMQEGMSGLVLPAADLLKATEKAYDPAAAK